MFDRMRLILESLGGLPLGWYGEGEGQPIQGATLDVAYEFINKLESWSIKTPIPSPHIGPSPAGRIGFDWSGTDTAGRELYVNFKLNKISVLKVDEENDIEEEFTVKGLDDLQSLIEWLTSKNVQN